MIDKEGSCGEGIFQEEEMKMQEPLSRTASDNFNLTGYPKNAAIPFSAQSSLRLEQSINQFSIQKGGGGGVWQDNHQIFDKLQKEGFQDHKPSHKESEEKGSEEDGSEKKDSFKQKRSMQPEVPTHGRVNPLRSLKFDRTGKPGGDGDQFQAMKGAWNKQVINPFSPGNTKNSTPIGSLNSSFQVNASLPFLSAQNPSITNHINNNNNTLRISSLSQLIGCGGSEPITRVSSSSSSSRPTKRNTIIISGPSDLHQNHQQQLSDSFQNPFHSDNHLNPYPTASNNSINLFNQNQNINNNNNSSLNNLNNFASSLNNSLAAHLNLINNNNNNNKSYEFNNNMNGADSLINNFWNGYNSEEIKQQIKLENEIFNSIKDEDIEKNSSALAQDQNVLEIFTQAFIFNQKQSHLQKINNNGENKKSSIAKPLEGNSCSLNNHPSDNIDTNNNHKFSKEQNESMSLEAKEEETSSFSNNRNNSNNNRRRCKRQVQLKQKQSQYSPPPHQNNSHHKKSSSRQSQHKNVYKNFGKELLRYVRAKRQTCTELDSNEFDLLLQQLTGGLNDKETKQTLPIQKKEQLQQLWTLKNPAQMINNNKNSKSKQQLHSSSNQHGSSRKNKEQLEQMQQQQNAQMEEIDKFISEKEDEIQQDDVPEVKTKKVFRKLSWEFFDQWAYQYVMTSRKLDKKEIHLKCIPSFLLGIIAPKSLEVFKPIREQFQQQAPPLKISDNYTNDLIEDEDGDDNLINS